MKKHDLVNTGILLSKEIIQKIDEARGRYSRSAFIEETVKKALKEEA